ncbi:MAG: 30S ribosome-binding factor RbfA [Thermodesulfobacteriota bacterium]|nr:MAG: 30S ribosome-binding factor RbfA [Thermodesulfobacteriota bacterium]
MNYGYKRADRVGDLVKEEIASMILRGEIKDPRVGFVTITMVKMSADLKEAKVYFSLIGSEEDKRHSLEGLKSAGGYMRRNLARRLNLKHIPTLSFFFDETLEYSEHIEEVLEEIKRGEGH